MNWLKILLFLLALLLLSFGAMFLIGLTFTVLKIAFWVLLIGGGIALLLKLFESGPKDVAGDMQTRLDRTELTLEEYKRKLEAQLKGPGEQ
jgi:hypothetical protein